MHVHTPPRSQRWRLAAAVCLFALFAVSCSDDGSADAETPDPTVAADTTTTTLPGTTAPIPETGAALADLELAYVDFADAGFVEFVNNGDETVDLAGLQICGGADCRDLGEVVEGGTVDPGDTARVDGADLGGLVADGGEVALYLAADFESTDAILSYVQWGVGGGDRAAVATEAEIWPSADSFVAVDPAFNSIESGGDAADPELWG